MKTFEKIVFDKFKEQTATIAENNDRIKKTIASLEEEKIKIISMIANGYIDKEDGKLALDKTNEKIQENKGYLQIEDETTPKLEEYWDFSKFFMDSVSKLWIDGDLDLRQRITGLTTPAGFHFKNKTVEPLRTPYFTRVFVSKKALNMVERAQEELNL